MTNFQVGAICLTVVISAACIATHSADPLWGMVLLVFIL